MNIILSSDPKNPLDADHVFVTTGPNCWGMSPQTAAAALAKCKSNAPSRYRGPYVTRVAHKSFQVDSIDGGIGWHQEHNAKDCAFCTVGKGVRVHIEPLPKIL